jgi:DnaJ-class molecular chaperone
MTVCSACNGDGGKLEETTETEGTRVVVRQTWHTCQSCGGR